MTKETKDELTTMLEDLVANVNYVFYGGGELRYFQAHFAIAAQKVAELTDGEPSAQTCESTADETTAVADADLVIRRLGEIAEYVTTTFTQAENYLGPMRELAANYLAGKPFDERIGRDFVAIEEHTNA